MRSGVKSTRWLLAAGFGLWMAAGCGSTPTLIMPTDEELAREMLPANMPPAKPAPTPAPATQYFTHIVQGPGETFMAIARWYTGNADHWKRIAQANPHIEPRFMRIGTAIRIPEELLITRRPMPRPAPAPPAASPQPSPAPEVELYGPIEKTNPPAPAGPADDTPELEPLEK
jgi:hypothetical protein